MAGVHRPFCADRRKPISSPSESHGCGRLAQEVYRRPTQDVRSESQRIQTSMELSPTALAPEAVRQQELGMLLAKASPERRAIFEKLQSRRWFQKSDVELQKNLLTLPHKGKENYDGFLEDLAARPEEIANIRVERLIDLPKGKFAVVPKFEVSRVDKPGIRFTYEYVSWNTGPLSGAKGVVFVEKEGKVSHFIVLSGEKFATGKPGFDSIGGFHDKGVDGVETIDDTIRKEIAEELGTPDIAITGIDRLGSMHPDAGMTNAEPELFAATISYDEMRRLPTQPVNPDIEELRTGTVVFPIDALPNVVMKNSDSFFLSTIARAWAKGIIPPPQGIEGKRVGFSLN